MFVPQLKMTAKSYIKMSSYKGKSPSVKVKVITYLPGFPLEMIINMQ